MAEFKNDKGETKYFSKDEIGKKRIITVEGTIWKRIPAPKQLSRFERLSIEIEKINEVGNIYEELILELQNSDIYESEFTDEQKEAMKEKLDNMESCFDLSGIEELRDEIENWKSGMEGTNLENSSKYEELSECYNNLDNAISSLEGIDIDVELGELTPEELADRFQEYVDEIENAVYELENVSFPGMY